MAQIIYDIDKLLYFYDGELFKVTYETGKLERLSFQEFIRKIDTCPDEGEKWKRAMIIKYAEAVGMLRCA